MSTSFDKLASVTASTKRSPSVSGGKRAAPVTNLTGVAVWPLTVVDAEIAYRLNLEAPHELLQTFTEEDDIQEGDFLVVGSDEYPVRAVADWPWRPGDKRLVLILEQLKR
jgi:hypothetical protein